jgi:site-specific DNA recombinase
MKTKPTQPEVAKRVAYYIRVSTEEQIEKFGLSMQRTAIQQMVDLRHLPDGGKALIFAGEEHVYLDGDVSGSKLLQDRPAFNRLMEDIINAPEGQKPFDVVAVYKIDRFARKLTILLDVIEFFSQHEIEFLSVNESIDTSTPFGKAILGIMGVIAELEVATSRQRMIDGRIEAVKTGKQMGSAPPYGYTKDKDKKSVILKKEADVVKKIFDYFLTETLTVGQIAKILTDQEVYSPGASAVVNKKRKGEIHKKNSPFHWRPEMVRQILSNEVYLGRYYYNKSKDRKRNEKEEWEMSPTNHPQIIDEVTFALAQDRLEKLKHSSLQTTKNKPDHVYLLSGLLKCDHCCTDVYLDPHHNTWVGAPKKIEGTTNYTFGYQCGGRKSSKHTNLCTVVPLPATEIETFVISVLRKLLADPKVVYKYHRDLKSNQLRIQKDQEEYNHFLELLNKTDTRDRNLKEQHEMGDIDTNTLRAKLDKVETDRKKYLDKLNALKNKISSRSVDARYQQTLELFSQKYATVLNQEVFTDRLMLAGIINQLVNKIMVYSRPVVETDRLAGRKKEGQHIPFKLDIVLNLPEQLLRQFKADFEKNASTDSLTFGVKTANLSGKQDSNLRPHAPKARALAI